MNRQLRYLLDTDMCIYLLNGEEQVMKRVGKAGIETIAVAIPTLAELYFGAYNSNHVETNISRIRSLFSPPGPTVLSINDEAANRFGRFKAELRREGQPIGDIDLLIAAVASSRGLTVVTNNTKHFERISEISLQNWLNSS